MIVAAQARDREQLGHEDAERYGEAVCIDCGHLTPRRLPERFPHLCTHCLFPMAPLGEVHVVGGRAWEEARP